MNTIIIISFLLYSYQSIINKFETNLHSAIEKRNADDFRNLIIFSNHCNFLQGDEDISRDFFRIFFKEFMNFLEEILLKEEIDHCENILFVDGLNCIYQNDFSKFPLLNSNINSLYSERLFKLIVKNKLHYLYVLIKSSSIKSFRMTLYEELNILMKEDIQENDILFITILFKQCFIFLESKKLITLLNFNKNNFSLRKEISLNSRIFKIMTSSNKSYEFSEMPNFFSYLKEFVKYFKLSDSQTQLLGKMYMEFVKNDIKEFEYALSFNRISLEVIEFVFFEFLKQKDYEFVYLILKSFEKIILPDEVSRLANYVISFRKITTYRRLYLTSLDMVIENFNEFEPNFESEDIIEDYKNFILLNCYNDYEKKSIEFIPDSAVKNEEIELIKIKNINNEGF